jgi:DNA-binding CsgD family transcriptional regulator
MIEQAEFLIIKYNLRRRCRNQYLVHQRAFLMSRLSKHGLSTTRIARMFKMNHATVLHNVRNAKYYEEIEDKYYLADVAEIREELESNPVVRNVTDLVSEILECTTVRRLEKIQRRILRNEYKLTEE